MTVVCLLLFSVTIEIRTSPAFAVVQNEERRRKIRERKSKILAVAHYTVRCQEISKSFSFFFCAFFGFDCQDYAWSSLLVSDD